MLTRVLFQIVRVQLQDAAAGRAQGVVDHDCGRAHLRPDARDGLDQGIEIGDVARIGAGVLILADERVEIVRIAGQHGDPVAALAEAFGGLGAGVALGPDAGDEADRLAHATT